MSLLRFGSLYLDPDQILYVRQFLPNVKGLPPDNEGGLRIGFAQREITLSEDDPGFAELMAWLDAHSQTPN
jgi:hypothetical protein